ncbi:MAG: hypothetical protein E7546_05485 [Ruminococcaceae bacterium]|nr:hypothetical protein [Oscillospiraceae bacterium]
MLCKNCNAEITEGLQFCPNCAAPIVEAPAAAVETATVEATPVEAAPIAVAPVETAPAEMTYAAPAPVEQAPAAPQLPVVTNTVPTPEPKSSKGKKALVISLIAAVVIIGTVIALFATKVLSCDGLKENLFPEQYSVVGEWEFVYGEESTKVFEIDEDHNLILADSDMEDLDSLGMDMNFSYNDDKEEIEWEMGMYGFSYTFSMPCKLHEDFLVVGMPDLFEEALGLDMDPFVLRRVGTDGDPVEFYKEEYEDDEYLWDAENPEQLMEMMDFLESFGMGDMYGSGDYDLYESDGEGLQGFGI